MPPQNHVGRRSRIDGLLKAARQMIGRASDVLQWGIDEPSESDNAEQPPAGVPVQGWVLIRPELLTRDAPPEVVATMNAHTELVLPLDRSRPDVISQVFQLDPNGHPQHCCGFRFVVPRHAAPFDLSLRLAGRKSKLMRVTPPMLEKRHRSPLKVLEGKGGWLFLANDTNDSVNQTSGNLQLTAKGLRAWQKYACGLQQFGKTNSAPSALLLSPTKESILGRYYPAPSGGQSPQQKLSRVIPEDLLVHPVASLAELGDESFLVSDTHCSDRGAMAVTVELAKTLGMPVRDVHALFTNDRYRPYEIVGDLGDKLTPERTSMTQRLDSFDHGNLVVYDNGLRSFGRIIATQNPDALLNKTCLTFGSSSSYLMLNYMSRIFERVVLVHTAANLDPHLNSAIKPDYLVAQTNARFVVRVPKLNYCVRTHIAKRVREQTDEEFEKMLLNQIDADQHWLTSSGLLPYQQIASRAIRQRKKPRTNLQTNLRTKHISSRP